MSVAKVALPATMIELTNQWKTPEVAATSV